MATFSRHSFNIGPYSAEPLVLKVDHLRTIHAMFALNWLTGFRGKKIKTFFQ
jgi:hypothetical protein